MKPITLAHSDLTKTIYAIIGKEKVDITNQAIAEVNAIKALEQESKTGHWELDESDNSITCAACGCYLWANDIMNGEANYCPNCGVKMSENPTSSESEGEMNREEAINHIKYGLIEDNYPLPKEIGIEALNMAIKALEIVEEFETALIITGGRLNGRTYAYKCGLEDGKRKALEQEPKTEWIPVGERLPEEGKTVIASVKGCIYPEARYTKEYGWEWAYESGTDYWEKLEDVIAWQPLPEPYESEGN